MTFGATFFFPPSCARLSGIFYAYYQTIVLISFTI